MRLLALAAVVGGLVAVAPSAAAAPTGGATMFLHSAHSGVIRGGRLMLRGVGHTVTWTTNGGRSGRVSIALMHHRLFGSGRPPATGTLHVANQRPGREQAFTLSRPRDNRSRQTVSYRVKRLDGGGRASGVASAAQSSGSATEFGPASLSIMGAPSVVGGTSGGNGCTTSVANNTSGYGLQAVGSSKWDTDDWDPDIPSGAFVDTGQSTSWGSDGGLFRGCSNSAVWQIVNGPEVPPASGTISFTTTYLWSGAYTNSCTSSNPQFTCQNVLNIAGQTAWWITRPPGG
jgi:hypothetical protein